MHILWHSHAPFATQAYGQQTALWTRKLKEAGHRLTLSAFDAHAGIVLSFEDMPVLPMGYDNYGNDVLPLYVQQLKPDAVVLLHDIWVLKEETLQALGPHALAWTPLDQVPVPPLTVQACRAVAHCATYTQWGVHQLAGEGLAPLYLPLAYDNAIFRPFAPGQRAQARARFQMEEDAFFAVCVATNHSVPSRKSLDRLLQAWGVFLQRRPGARLYLHCQAHEIDGGYNLERLAQACDIPPCALAFPDSHALDCGQYNSLYLADLYNAADVLVLPSAGEGFGLPLIEAQACGTPVLTTDYSAMTELCRAGYLIPLDEVDDLLATPLGGLQADIRPSAILAGLEWMAEEARDPALRQQAIQGAAPYEINTVMREHFLPALQQVAEGEP